MTVVFTPSGGSAVSLAGADAGGLDGASGLRMGGQSMVQQEPQVRGSVAVFDRSNRRVSGSLTARKQHTDHHAAMTYVAAHIAALAGVGTLVFTWTGGSLTLTSAHITAEGRDMGATSEWTYSFEGTQ